ncbi:MAG TPA: hypothetical protein VGY56_02545 [Verrucomicrobiae bacterium]|nr:hypothetical protein [Verrucomicrobiae bacterium]
MNDKLLFTWQRLPGRLDAKQAAELLGFLPYELSVVVRNGLVRPLGKPAPNGHKFFCSAEILQLSQDRDWLDKATRAVAKCWKEKNQKQGDMGNSG